MPQSRGRLDQVVRLKELLRTNDLVLISRIEFLMAEADIPCLVLDTYMSALEGSLGFLPRRIAVADEGWRQARRLLEEAGLGHELPAER